MEEEGNELAIAEFGGCDPVIMGISCCQFGSLCPYEYYYPKPPPTCMDHCVDIKYSQCMSCDDCTTTHLSNQGERC